MGDSKKPEKINLDLDDQLEVVLEDEPQDRLVVNIEDMSTGSKANNLYHGQPEPVYAQRMPPKRKRSKLLKMALITLSFVFLFSSFFLLSNLFFGSEPEVIALENPSFRPTDPTFIIKDPQTGAEIVAGEIVIIARESSSAEDINRIAASVGGKVIGSMEDINIYQVELPEKDVDAIRLAINQLEQNDYIETVTANIVPQMLGGAQRLPKDPQWTDWAEHRRWGQEYINLPQAWALTTGSHKVKIGIIEKGFDLEHTDLKHMKVVMGDPKLWEKKLAEYGAPVFNHGNMVSGIIGALSNNNKGLAGVLWEADYYCYIIFSLLDFANAVEDSDKNRVRVLNLSFIFADWANGGQFDDNDFKTTNGQLIWLVNKYNDILFVQGAGNNSNVLVDYMPLASSATEYDNVITVGAIDKNGKRVEAFTYGCAVSVAAPGKDIWSATSRDFRSIYFPPLFDSSYGEGSGTSYATPFVTGVAGLILSVAPELGPGEVKRIIMDTAQPHVFDDSIFSLGTGVVDAYAAVLRADVEAPPDGEEEEHDINPEETKLDDAKRREIIYFMEKATSNIVAFLPEFNDPHEISNDDLIFILIFNGITPSTWDAGDGIIRFTGEDVEWAAKTIFGPQIKDITHRSVDNAIWDDSKQEYHFYAFGPTSFTENHVVSIKEEPGSYVFDLVHLLYYYGDYDRPDETDIYDEYGNLVTVVKGNQRISESMLKNLPVRRYVLTKTSDGDFYIVQSRRSGHDSRSNR